MSEKLAILGGQPIRKQPLPAYNTIGSEEKRAVNEVLDSGELSGFVAGYTDAFWGGRCVRALEAEFKRYFDVSYAVAVNSATSGLHCALSATGIGPGDEVIVSPYTMSASATTILMTGAVPIFADVDLDTYCLCPESVEKNLSPNTKGIVAVNIFGHPAELDALRQIADRHNLFLIEDNAQAPDAAYKGKKTGTIGDAGVFSFNRHKTMQCGEGGVVITNNDQLAFKAACMRNHGEVLVGPMGVKDIVNTIGVNYRMTEIEAAIALIQFRKLPALNKRRIELAEQITRGLSELDGLEAPMIKPECSHVYYFYAIKYDEAKTGLSRDLFAKAVTAEGFNLRPGYVQPLYREPVFQKKICFGSSGHPFIANSRIDEIDYSPRNFPNTEQLQNEKLLITNIIYEPLTTHDMDQFVGACRKVLNGKEQLIESLDDE